MASVCPSVTLSPRDTFTDITCPLAKGNTLTTLLSSLDTSPDRFSSSFMVVVLAVSMVIIFASESLIHTCLLSGASCSLCLQAAKNIRADIPIKNVSFFINYLGFYYCGTYCEVQIGNG